ncbi:MAG TPA: glycosyltransferase [Povalibacter sp.]
MRIEPLPTDARQTDPAKLSPARRGRVLLPSAGERVLLLTSGLGYGHVRAAQAIEAALLQRSLDVRSLDLWSLMHPGAASIVHQTYLRLVQEYPELYERIYQLDERTWRQILESESGPPPDVLEVLELISQIANATVAGGGGGMQYATDRLLLSLLCNSLPFDGSSLGGTGVRARLAIMKWSWLRLRKRLESIVTDQAPDLIISTQMIPAAMICALKRRGRINVPVVGVLTDYGLHDFWRQRGIDCYCVAHSSLAGTDRSDSVRSVPTGVPLMPAFAHPMTQAEAKRQLGLDPERAHVLILGGGLGLSVDAIAENLLSRPGNWSLIVMPGKNADARQSLSRMSKDRQRTSVSAHERVHVFEWTERMDVFIRASDVVVGKPGGVSVAEVLACGRPLLATRSLGGQEGFNVRFLEQHGVGALVSETELASRIETMIGSPDELAAIQQRAWSLGVRDGAARVAELTLDLLAGRRRVPAREST